MTLFQEKTLLPGIIILSLGSLLGYILFPVLDVSNLLLGILAKEITSYQLLQLLVSSILLILLLTVLFLLYSYYLRSKYHHKKIYRFGVYWHKHKPYCPYCGGKLVETPFEFLECPNCGEIINLCDGKAKTFLKYKDALAIIKKET